ncbi:serine hydrolase domain-containing protein [uncultured Thiohalocapsa sp.]|uniref:serine hydrolase n=1 Tax=uncultured Thiohalocapsa sp. TaxID=768990 RepID=UPI0025EAF06C|nr:serine hydrolase domain-containing protein [uncultured Thiohalocapsa sp.]
MFSYSNVGYTVLGHLVQHLAAEPFAVHLGRTLFAPLHMEATRIASLPARADALAIGHRRGRPLTPLPIRDLPAQGLQTTARDVATPCASSRARAAHRCCVGPAIWRSPSAWWGPQPPTITPPPSGR